MSKMTSLLVSGILAVCVSPAVCGDPAELPAGLKGFRGMLRGTLVSKADNSFVLKVDKVLRVWKENKAADPQSAVGKELTIRIRPDSRMADKFLAALAELKVGDPVEVEPFNLEGDSLVVVETLRKAETQTPEQAEIARLKARIAELEKLVAELRAENERLRRELAARD